MGRYCDLCETKLPNGHGFVTRKGQLVCGRISTRRTVNGALTSVKLPCAKAAGL